MEFRAKTKFVRVSPYKLRPIADIVRGKSIPFALAWLETHRVQRVRPIQKLIKSAVANAQQNGEIAENKLMIKELCVDQGPIIDYFKPGAQGRANPQRKRLSHIKVILQVVSGQGKE